MTVDISIRVANSLKVTPSRNTIVKIHCKTNVAVKKYISHMWFFFFIPKKTTIVRTKAAEIPKKLKHEFRSRKTSCSFRTSSSRPDRLKVD